MAVVFKKTNGLTDAVTHYCPGCTHGIIHRLVAEVLDEMDLLGIIRRCYRGSSCRMFSISI